MNSIDTNILVRYYAQDDVEHSEIAMRLFRDEHALFVTKTVLLEFYWVLTQADKFRFPPKQVIAVLEHLQGLPNVQVEDAPAIQAAIAAAYAGLEFPDALHLTSSSACVAFLTFDDRKFARRAQRLNMIPTCEIPN